MRSLLARWTILPLLAVPGSTWAFGLGEIEPRSTFNQPLRAQIELLSATPDVLETLSVGLAPAATFERFGVDRPAFLTSLEFSVGRDAAGRSVVLVRSIEPVRELFVTVLVEARWSGGISLREYTVLLDLPVQPERAGDQPATVAAPRPSTPAQAARPEAAGGDGLTHGPVQRAETLWDIAARYRPAGVTMNQAMVAIYRANPRAFGSNMNVLRIGAVLQIPDLLALRGAAANTATVEVDRQTAEWQGRASQQASSTVASPSPALPPSEEARPDQLTQPQSAAGDAQLTALQGQIGALQSDLEEIRSQLAIRDQQLADLRAQLAASRAAEAATPREPETVVPPSAAVARAVDLESIPPFPEQLPVAEPVSPASLVIAVVSAAVGAGALLWVALRLRRRRAGEAIADRTDRVQLLETQIEPEDTRADDTAQLPANVPDDFIVHEQSVKKTVRDKDGGWVLVDEEADSLAEADFHIAYGSYDQAAARLSRALAETPDNRELKLRLMEVYFQWGNEEAFLEVAREFHADPGTQANNDWDKVVIMGRQLCPDEGLFAESTPSAGEVDVDLQTQDAPALDLALGEQDGAEIDVERGMVHEDTATLRSDDVVDVGELRDSRESPTVTQERHELAASATLDEAADVSPTAVMGEPPEPVTAEESEEDIPTEMLPAKDMIGQRADDEEKDLALVDDFATKVDLAKAYMSIGQPELAVPMLEEALRESNGESERARRMLEEALQEAEAAVAKTKRSA